ncbi:hypothetical protein, partial [uncultured Sulfitobacter sp.]|uniref:hypothetical protein n=1 Tax=unclassified Sulfitobacter TaxID=196795 RepID=UPI002597D048
TRSAPDAQLSIRHIPPYLPVHSGARFVSRTARCPARKAVNAARSCRNPEGRSLSITSDGSRFRTARNGVKSQKARLANISNICLILVNRSI